MAVRLTLDTQRAKLALTDGRDDVIERRVYRPSLVQRVTNGLLGPSTDIHAQVRVIASMQLFEKRPPYSSVRAWLRGQWRAFHPILPSEAVQRAEELADVATQRLGVDLDRIWRDTRFGPLAARLLAAGATCAVAGGVIGAMVGPIGAVVGAAIGFVAGCVAGAIPVSQWDTMAAWSQLCDALTPAERYFLFAGFRAQFDRLRDLDGNKPEGPWRISHEFTTIYAAQGVAVFCWHAVWDRDSVPQPSGATTGPLVQLDPVALYALGLALVEIGDEESIYAGEGSDHARNGSGNRWVGETIKSLGERTKAGEVRAELARRGLHDYAPSLVTPSIERAVADAQGAIAAAQARARAAK